MNRPDQILAGEAALESHEEVREILPNYLDRCGVVAIVLDAVLGPVGP